jgi:O-methyltransferase involved in polyketide biosynthesis
MGEKIDVSKLRGTQGTAISVLEPKAYYAKSIPREDWELDFSKALAIWERLTGTEMYTLSGNNDTKRKIAAIGLVLRSKSFEELIDHYLGTLEDPVLVHFGPGLSDRSERYKAQMEQGLDFYDVDFSDMMEFRRKFYEDFEHYKMLDADLSTYTWLEQIPAEQRKRPFVFVAEGVSPYLTEAQMKEMFSVLKENFPGCLLIFDTYSQLKLKGMKKDIAQMEAEFFFANEDPAEMVGWGEKGEYVHLQEDNLLHRKDFLEHKHLNGFYKWLMGIFARWFRWNKGVTRSTIVHVFQLGKAEHTT